MIDPDFDFGFTAVDEDELEAVQQQSAKTEIMALSANRLEEKIDKLYNAILPLLSNLKRNPEKDYIYWPKRTAKIEEFEALLQRILEG
jgi:uncharacterized protein Yka (UPF0111/DUF47 family)